MLAQDDSEPAGPSFAQRAARNARAFGRVLLDLAYPPSCIACQAATAAPRTLCPSCWRKVRFIERPFCERLGTPFTHDLGPGALSPQAIADPPAYGRRGQLRVMRTGRPPRWCIG